MPLTPAREVREKKTPRIQWVLVKLKIPWYGLNPPIKKGELFTEENLTVKRPGTGISPMVWDTIISQKAKEDFNKDDLIHI